MNEEKFYKEYMNKFIKRQRIISIICISFVLLSSTISAFAVSAYLYNGNEVSYNNNASGITSNNVQGAIDELYGHVTDYTTMDTRVSAIESKFRDGSTSYFSQSNGTEWLRLGIDNSTSGYRGIITYDENNKARGQLYYAPSDSSMNLYAGDSSGTAGKGKLYIYGKPITISANTGGNGDLNLNGNVKINGKDTSDSGWVTVTSIVGSMRIRKKFNVVEFYYWNDKSIAAEATIATLPVGYRPTINTYPNKYYLSSVFNPNDIIGIDNDGVVKNSGNAISNTSWSYFHDTWIVD